MNYSFKFYLFLLLVLSFQNCEKDITNDIKIDQISDARVKLNSFVDGFTLSSVDAYIVMQSAEYIGNCSARSLDMFAVFNEGDDIGGKPIIEGIELQKVIEDGQIRYNTSESPLVLEGVLAEGKIDCEFDTEQINKYVSFSKKLSFPDLLCAESSIASDDFFPKNDDLTITWSPDKNTDEVYVAVCAAGVPCFLGIFPDTGSLTISSDEFSLFEQGQSVYIYIGRGIADIIEQSNGVRVGLIRANWANLPGLVVE